MNLASAAVNGEIGISIDEWSEARMTERTGPYRFA